MEATGKGRPHLRVSDFGISMRKGEPRLTETNYVVGTPGYFAPEQMLGAEPDFTADLFAAGLVALYLLQGRKPDSQALVEHFAEHGTPSAPQGVPEPLWQVIAGLLQPDPQARFRSATGARKALTTAVELLPEPAPGEEPVEVFDQLGPLPAGFGPNGPEAAQQAPGQAEPVQQPALPSETGSFHLAPPPQQPPAQPPHTPQPHPAQPHPPAAMAAVGESTPSPTQLPSSAPVAAHTVSPLQTQQTQPMQSAPPPFGGPATHTYTAHAPQVPQRGAGKRPGPPPKVAVPVLLVAVLCFAVGIWALTQV
jgi:serine/threonine protein kinase